MDSPRPLILVIDDNKTARESLMFVLRNDKYRFAQANSGETALAQLAQEIPAIILLDVVMPDMNGYELCKKIKADEGWAHVPIILITALASQEALVIGLESGADEFLTKPVSTVELRARIRSMLRIRRQHDELRATIQLREDMASMMAHDIRGPLTVMSMSSYILNLKCEDPELHRHVKTIERQVFQLEELVNQSLLLAKSAASELVLNRQPTDVVALMNQLVLDTEPAVGLAQVSLDLKLPPEPIIVPLDRHLFRRAIDNLLSNAVKFSPVDGTVSIGMRLDDQMRLLVEVADNGYGIPESERERIFDRFEVGKARRAGVRQIGLGLAFCKLVINAHGGDIRVRDNTPTGALFAVTIP